ncbi:hypothetical protein PSPO01_04313 [Paraphaeosphaeria sporulosa]
MPPSSKPEGCSGGGARWNRRGTAIPLGTDALSASSQHLQTSSNVPSRLRCFSRHDVASHSSRHFDAKNSISFCRPLSSVGQIRLDQVKMVLDRQAWCTAVCAVLRHGAWSVTQIIALLLGAAPAIRHDGSAFSLPCRRPRARPRAAESRSQTRSSVTLFLLCHSSQDHAAQ